MYDGPGEIVRSDDGYALMGSGGALSHKNALTRSTPLNDERLRGPGFRLVLSATR